MRVLTLDDMETRADKFRQWFIGHEHVHVYTAKDATRELGGPRFDLVMLDHDLAEEHYLARPVGAPEYSPGTGMDVVDFIIEQARAGAPNLPDRIIVHSFNTPRAIEMCSRLKDAGIVTYRIPFGMNPLG